ncbi:hypothetical protein [Deinococcus ficus]|uniref:Lipoprotein n=1 Tax=Deinococcus ficus TaxID=317577 RepID=A0A221T2Q3_9DEIO|nr:hypothetical protein [Deinococcus ficus]ASN83141.1 hypothetical protein DFI_18240 [Deinococcus ficus]
MKPSLLTLLLLGSLLSSCGDKNAASKDILQAALPQDAGPACVPVDTTFIEVLDEGSYDLEMYSENLHARAADAGLLSVSDGTETSATGTTYPVKVVKHTPLFKDIIGKVNADQLCYGAFAKSVIDTFEVTDEGKGATAKVVRPVDREEWATDPVTTALGVRVPDSAREVRFKRDGDRWFASDAQN